MAEMRSLSLLQRLAGARRVARAPEPADLGTAFGLEQSLSEFPPAAAPAVESPRAGWWQRLTARQPAR